MLPLGKLMSIACENGGRKSLMVGDAGLEPATSRSQSARASQLRQSP